MQLTIDMEGSPIADDMYLFRVENFAITALYPKDTNVQTVFDRGDLSKYGIEFPVNCSGCYFKLRGAVYFRGNSYPFNHNYVTVNSNSQASVKLPENLKEEVTGAEWRSEASIVRANLEAYDFEGQGTETFLHQIFWIARNMVAVNQTTASPMLKPALNQLVQKRHSSCPPSYIPGPNRRENKQYGIGTDSKDSNGE